MRSNFDLVSKFFSLPPPRKESSLNLRCIKILPEGNVAVVVGKTQNGSLKYDVHAVVSFSRDFLQISALRRSITVESAFLCEQPVNEEKGKMHFQINIWEYLRQALL